MLYSTGCLWYSCLCYSLVLCDNLERCGRWEGGLRGRGCVHLWLIHVDVCQKPIRYCKAIILHLKINLKKEKILLPILYYLIFTAKLLGRYCACLIGEEPVTKSSSILSKKHTSIQICLSLQHGLPLTSHVLMNSG